MKLLPLTSRPTHQTLSPFQQAPPASETVLSPNFGNRIMHTHCRHRHLITPSVVAVERGALSNEKTSQDICSNAKLATSSHHVMMKEQAGTSPSEHDAAYHLSSRLYRLESCRATHPLTPYYKCEAYIWAEYVEMMKLPTAQGECTGCRLTKEAERHALTECLSKAMDHSRPAHYTSAA